MSSKRNDLLSTGPRWAEERERLGLSRAAIAKEAGRTPQAIGEFERGVAWPGGEALAAFARLGADIQYVLTGVRNGEARRADGMLDAELLATIIDAIEQVLEREEMEIEPRKKADVIAGLYEIYRESGGAVNTASVVRLVKTAA